MNVMRVHASHKSILEIEFQGEQVSLYPYAGVQVSNEVVKYGRMGMEATPFVMFQIFTLLACI